MRKRNESRYSFTGKGLSLKILIIEDEANQRKLLKKILSKEGYTVEEAGSGEEGVGVFSKDFFDLVLFAVEQYILLVHN